MFSKTVVFIIILAFFSFAEEIQIFPDKDITILDDSGTKSNALGDLFVGTTNNGNIRRALIHFDVAAAVPAGATIDSVTLSLTVNKTKAGSEMISIHTLTANWGEGSSIGSGGGAPATPNDATWTHAFFDSLLWTTEGGDFISTADESISVAGLGEYIWGSNAEMAADVQNWLDKPDQNFGWLIKGNESVNTTTKSFDSREGIAKPALNIAYSITTAIKESHATHADQFRLSKNYPNPFNPSTKIDVSIPSTNNQNIDLQVFNITGQLVKTIYTGILPSGNYTFQWDGNNINGNRAASGVYFYKLHGQNFQIMKKMILVK